MGISGANPYSALLNPSGTDSVFTVYNASNKSTLSKIGSFEFGDYAFYTNTYSTATLDALTNTNVLATVGYVKAKASSANFPPSSNLSMGGSYKFTNLAAGTSNGDSVRFE